MSPEGSMEPVAPGLLVSSNGYAGRGPARVSRVGDLVPGLVTRLSTSQLFSVWMGTVVLCGFGYWLGAVIGEHGLMEAGSPIGANLHGLLSALYFSFVTATS